MNGASRARRRQVLALALLAAVAVITWVIYPRSPAFAPAAEPIRVATVVRTDVASGQLVSGTLGYSGAFSVLDRLGAGTITWTPPVGAIVHRDQQLFRVDDMPAFLLTGTVPAWRPFRLGMTPGPDVRELAGNLVALGFGGRQTLGDAFTTTTRYEVRRWQHAEGLAETGYIPVGEITFLPTQLRITRVLSPPGLPAGSGSVVLEGTSTDRIVTVDLPVGSAVHRGEQVSVVLPDGTRTLRGEVVSVGTVAVAPSPSAVGGPATITVTIAAKGLRDTGGLDQAPVQVTLTSVEHSGVLAVPVTALLARSGGGYAVQLANGAHGLVSVNVGLFDDSTGLVEVSGPGVAAGIRVQVAVG